MILRLASKFPGRRDQLLFLINNYDVVSSIDTQVTLWYQSRTIEVESLHLEYMYVNQVMSIIIERTKDDSKESETFREQLKSRSDEFAEQMLEQHFGALIGYG